MSRWRGKPAGDLIAGAALVGLGVAMGVVARGFPSIGAMSYGPGLFPTVVAVGLAASGLGILAEALAAGAAREGGGARPRIWAIVALLAVVAFFAATLQVLGFHLAAAAALLAAVRIFGGGWVQAALVAVLAPLLLHLLFYNLLRVPLPWGVLTPIAW